MNSIPPRRLVSPLSFWVAIISTFALVFVALGCSKGSGFPEPYARGEVLRSGLTIPAGQTFLLGGGQPAGFIVQAYNEGDVAIELIGDPADSSSTPKTIFPGSQSEAAFVSGQTARLTNTSDTKAAKLKVTITSLEPGQQLGMRYVDR